MKDVTDTRFEKLKNYLLNNRTIAVLGILLLLFSSVAVLLEALDTGITFWEERVAPVIKGKPVEFIYFDEAITFGTQNGLSYSNAVKIYGAESLDGGISAEYFWLSRRYPDYVHVEQALVLPPEEDPSSKLLMIFINDRKLLDFSDLPDPNRYSVDILTIKNSSGDSKDLYFDISSFEEKPFKDPIVAAKIERMASTTKKYLSAKKKKKGK